MKPLKEMQLKCGLTVASAAGPTHGEGLWIWNHREEETAGARFTRTERQWEGHAAPIEFFLNGCFVVHVDAKDRRTVQRDCYGGQRGGRRGAGRADTGACDDRGLCSTRNDAGGGAGRT
jgi:hypothetical protein